MAPQMLNSHDSGVTNVSLAPETHFEESGPNAPYPFAPRNSRYVSTLAALSGSPSFQCAIARGQKGLNVLALYAGRGRRTAQQRSYRLYNRRVVDAPARNDGGRRGGGETRTHRACTHGLGTGTPRHATRLRMTSGTKAQQHKKARETERGRHVLQPASVSGAEVQTSPTSHVAHFGQATRRVGHSHASSERASGRAGEGARERGRRTERRRAW